MKRSKPRSETVVLLHNEGKIRIVKNWRRADNSKRDSFVRPFKPYSVNETVTYNSHPKYLGARASFPSLNLSNLKDRVYAQAWDKFSDDLRQNRNSLGMTLGQIDKSLQQIAMYTDRVRKSYQQVRRGNISQAFKTLYKQRAPKQRRKAKKMARNSGSTLRKDVSGAILEWSYGIQPILIELEGLRERVEGGHAFFKFNPIGRATLRETLEAYLRNKAGYRRHEQRIRCQIQARCSLVNPNYALADSLGLLNPLLIVNDAIPFSFVVNYFTGHEKWLSSLTAYAGVRIEVSSISYKTITQDMREWYKTLPNNEVLNHTDRTTSYVRTIQGSPRIPGLLDRVVLIPHMPLQRAVNSAALLTTLLTKH